MGRPRQPLERQALKAKGDGLTPSKTLVPKGVTTVSNRSVPAPLVELGERGSEEWAKTWIAGRNWLHPDKDYHWVEQIALAYDEIATFRADIEAQGRTIRGSMGQTIAHPLYAEIRKCQETIRKCLSMLGFSPSDRSRLGIIELKAQNELEKMMDRQRENDRSQS